MFAFCVALPLHLVWIAQGIDVTDEGLNLTQQWLALEGSSRFVVDLRWLSDVLGGLWLALVGDLGLLGARAGWALASACATGLAAFTLGHYFPLRRSALAALATAGAGLHHWPMVLDYNTIPGLLLLGSLALLVLSRQDAWRAREPVLAAAAGTMLALAIMARFVLLPAVALCLVTPALSAWRGQTLRLPRDHWRGPGWFLLGTCGGLLACVAFLAAVGWLDDLLATFAWRLDDEHSPHRPSQILRGHTFSLLRAVLMGLEWAAVVAVGHVALRLLLGRRRLLQRALLLALAVGVLLLKVSFSWPGFAYLFPGVALALSALLVLGFLRLAPPDDARSARLTELLALAALVALSTMIGSAQGVTAVRNGLWVLLPAAVLALPDLARRLPAHLDREAWAQELRVLGAVWLVSLGAVGLFLRAQGPWRDLPNRLYLTHAVDHPLLRGARTTRGRATSLEQLLTALAERVEPGDELLAYSNLPLLYYLTGTHPALGHPWPKGELSLEQLEAELNGAWRRGAPLAVRARADVEDPRWGTATFPWDAHGVPLIVNRIDQELAARGYVEVWSNRDFVIMAPPEQESARNPR